MKRRLRRILALAALLLLAVFFLTPAPLPTLLRYWIFPDAPRFRDGEEIVLPGLREPVDVHEYADGRYRISARNEEDLYRVHGYLQARDRLFQMDLFRHIARGRLAEMVGDRAFGPGRTTDVDVLHRFLGFEETARALYAAMPPGLRHGFEAYAQGVNAWIAEGRPTVEHRLLGLEARPWDVVDTLAVTQYLSFGLSHNYTRELRRLLVACDAGLEAAERIWPSEIEFGVYFLPPEDFPAGRHPLPPAIAPELARALPELCPRAVGEETARESEGSAWFRLALSPEPGLFRFGLSSSNNWVLSGERSKSGKPLLANDPHLPHMNPPVLWGVHHVLPDREVVGFTIPGLHLVLFGHNFRLAWAATTNNLDLQDLYVEREAEGGYVYEGEVEPFEWKTEEFRVRDGDAFSRRVRFTRHGIVLDDVEEFLRGRIPTVSLRRVLPETAGDALAIDLLARARTVEEALEALEPFEATCSSWLVADRDGNFAFSSPCRIPVRPHWQGTFPVPGWLARYEWQGFVPKDALPTSRNPRRGWLATANNRAFPRDRFFTAYINDPSPPNRYVRIGSTLEKTMLGTVDEMRRLQTDTVAAEWTHVRSRVLATLCRADLSARPFHARARDLLCQWDGDLSPDSSAATLYVLLTHALLDRTFADELTGGPRGSLWNYLQSIPHVETNVEWLWRRSADDPVWDDVRTAKVETRDETVAAAFADAVQEGRRRWGDDLSRWEWGKARPFELRHPLAGAHPVLRRLFDPKPLPGRGAPETVFKNQFLRADRESLHVAVGPVARIVVDLAAPERAGYSLAGGQSGWPRSPHYADLLQDWMENRLRPLTPRDDGGLDVRFLPPSSLPAGEARGGRERDASP
ncbi:MAG: peptidase S45 [Candidatus Binatia bacterium]|nr:MAG: peptidase S45 [Candidatus Binatia bacterium]